MNNLLEHINAFFLHTSNYNQAYQFRREYQVFPIVGDFVQASHGHEKEHFPVQSPLDLGGFAIGSC